MKKSTIALLTLLYLTQACDLTLNSVSVPATVNSGEEFDIYIQGTGSNGVPGDVAAAVLQLPQGFVLIDAWYSEQWQGNILPVVLNDPLPASLYTPEPGHTVVAISANAAGPPSGAQGLRVRIRASAVGGNYMLKVSLCGTQTSLTAQQPLGITNFNQINSPPYAHPIVVNGTSQPTGGRFSPDAQGLGGFAMVGWTGVATGDFNGDGLSDLTGVIGDTGGPSAFIRQANGGWQQDSAGLAYNLVSSNSCDVTTGDFNGDGLVDIADGNGRAFFRLAVGGWLDSSSGLPQQGFEGVASGDVNGDGYDDLVFGSQLSSEIRFFFSNGNGNWTESSAGLPLPIPGVGTGRQIQLVDLNGDGILDILWMFNGAIVWFLGTGGNSWIPQVPTYLPLELASAEVLDVDGDGDLDLIVAASMAPTWLSGAPPTQPGGLLLFRAEPAMVPRFVIDTTSGLPATGVEYMSVVAMDIDGDGVKDVVAGRVHPDFGVDVWRGMPGGQYIVDPALSVGLPSVGIGRPYRLVTADFNGDGGPDLAGAFWGMGLDTWQNTIATVMGPCAAGNTGVGLGGPYNTLTINGTDGLPTRMIDVPVGSPISLGVSQPPSNPNPADFIIWGGFGIPALQDVFSTPYGNMCFPPSSLLPYPGLFIVASTFTSAIVPATQAPFTYTAPAGVPTPLTVVMQGMIVHQSAVANNLAITNAVILRVQ